MLKQKRTRFLCLLLAGVMLALVPIPVMATEGVPQEPSSRAIQSWEIAHNYSEDIIDGGIYYIRNVATQACLDVDYGDTANGTGVSAYPYHGGENQRFRLYYLGEGLYEIRPVYVDRVLNITENDELTIADKGRNGAQRFKLLMQASSTAIILSEFSGFNKALRCDDADGDASFNVRETSNFASNSAARWEFIRADSTTADLYRVYYIKHAETGHYLDVVNGDTANGSLLHTCLFYGNSNEEWKLIYDYTIGSYYLKAGHRRDMAVDYTEQRAKIRYDGSPITQGLSLIPVPVEGASDIHYRIATTGDSTVKYLSQGECMDSDNSTMRYVDFVEDADDLWLLEEVTVDMKTPEKLTLNEFYEESMDAAYHETEHFVYAPEKTSRYKVELESNVSLIWEIVARSDGSCPEIDTYVRESSGSAPERRVADVFLEAGEIYYIAIRYIRNPAAGAINIRTRVRQWVFVGHSYNGLKANGQLETVMDDDIKAIEDSVQDNMNFAFDHMEQITSSAAKQGINSITNYHYFNSEIFVYSGHGIPAAASYNGYAETSSSANKVVSYDLPDMSNCELVIWDCCYSAVDYHGHDEFGDYTVESLAAASIARGARTVIAWNSSMCSWFTENFMNFLFEEIEKGLSINNAYLNALSRVSLLTHSSTCGCGDSSETSVFVQEARIYGDLNHIIYPIN